MKYVKLNRIIRTHCRPRKGAWIEIATRRLLMTGAESPPQGGVD